MMNAVEQHFCDSEAVRVMATVSQKNSLEEARQGMSVRENRVTFKSNGLSLKGNLILPEEGCPCVLLCHGLESSKDSTKWQRFSKELARVGLGSFRFNFRGCGQGNEASEGIFADVSLTNQVDDLRAAIETLAPWGVDINRLGIIGSSFGGATAIAAAHLPLKVRVLMATPSHFREMESLLVPGQEFITLPSGRQLHRTFCEDSAKYNLPKLLAIHPYPTLLLHGDEDQVVPISHAELLYGMTTNPSALEVISKGNHNFATPAHLNLVIRLAVRWMKSHL